MAEIELLVILLLSGVLVGFINTLAGGGTVISVATFMAMGLPIVVATGTNRIPVIMQNLVASIIFKKQKLYTFKEAFRLAIPILLGSIISAQFTTMMDDTIFTYIFMGGLLLFCVLLFYKPDRWQRTQSEIKKVAIKEYIILFVIGLYGGSVYIGIGYMLLALFVLSLGYDLIRANALKNLMALMLGPLSIIPFILTDNVNYSMGLAHGIGNVFGAFIASHYAKRIGHKFIRKLLVVMVICSVIYTVYDTFFK